METRKKFGVGTVVLTLVLGLIAMWVVNRGLALINSPSDAGVVGGIAILLLVGVGAWFYGKKVLKPRLTSGQVNGTRSAIAILAVAVSMLAGSGCTRIGPGHVGIEVDLAGSQRGVQDFTLKTGWVFYNPASTDVKEYPTYVQTAVWTKSPHEGKPVNEEITFTTGDQMKVDADISLAYHLVAEKVPAFYVKFRSDDLDQFTHGFLRNLAREKFDNIAGKYKIEDIMGDNAQFLADTRKVLQESLDPQGVILDQFGFIGAPRPPPSVVDAINEKVKAVQQAIMVENQLRSSKAEAQKRIAAAEGEARSNQVLTSSLSPTLLEWRRLELQGQAISKWNGNLPTYSGGGAIPFLQIPQK